MNRREFLRTMRILDARYPANTWAKGLTPFEVLVSTILSQSTTATNERRGMDGLRTSFGSVTPKNLAHRGSNEIARAIRPAGLSAQKAPRIRATAIRICATSDASLHDVLARPTKDAREILMGLPGVGPKTADVVLAVAGNHPVFPVDTHVSRIAGRWKLGGGGYEAIRERLERWTPPKRRRTWHLALIAHGRTLCKASNPRCALCPVSRDCDWFQGRQRRRAKRLKGSDR